DGFNRPREWRVCSIQSAHSRKAAQWSSEQKESSRQSASRTLSPARSCHQSPLGPTHILSSRFLCRRIYAFPAFQTAHRLRKSYPFPHFPFLSASAKILRTLANSHLPQIENSRETSVSC